MKRPACQILLCASFRTDGDPKGACHKKGSVALMPYLENEINDRGIDAQLISTGCMKACDHGPVMVIQPQGVWYGGVDSEEKVDTILEALEQDGTVDEYLLP